MPGPARGSRTAPTDCVKPCPADQRNLVRRITNQVKSAVFWLDLRSEWSIPTMVVVNLDGRPARFRGLRHRAMLDPPPAPSAAQAIVVRFKSTRPGARRRLRLLIALNLEYVVEAIDAAEHCDRLLGVAGRHHAWTSPHRMSPRFSSATAASRFVLARRLGGLPFPRFAPAQVGPSRRWRREREERLQSWMLLPQALDVVNRRRCRCRQFRSDSER